MSWMFSRQMFEENNVFVFLLPTAVWLKITFSTSPFLMSMFRCFRDKKASGHLFLHYKKKCFSIEYFLSSMFSKLNSSKIKSFSREKTFFLNRQAGIEPKGVRRFLSDNSAETFWGIIQQKLFYWPLSRHCLDPLSECIGEFCVNEL